MSYNEATLEYFWAARGAGTLRGPGVVRGSAGSRDHGTWVQFDFRLEPGGGGRRLVAEARFLAYGCPHTIAAAALIVELAAGRLLEAGLPVSTGELQRRFEVPVEKLGRLLIVEDAWAAAARATEVRPVEDQE